MVSDVAGPVRMFIGGGWTAAASGATSMAMSPATGESLGAVPEGDREDTRRALDAAALAFPSWSGATPFDRARLLHRIGEVCARRRDELARTLTLDQGKPLRAEAYEEVDELTAFWHLAAEDAVRLEGVIPPSSFADKRVLVVRRARGPIGVITPWNWPYTMPAELIAPALACGNTVVWTPAPSTAVCSALLAECVAEADLPAGVFNFVTGPGPVVGDEIAGNPATAGVAFIGSTGTGLQVARRAAGKAQLLEMGGNGPLVVMDDADLEQAIAATITGCFLCACQSCTASERLLVHRNIREEFATQLAKAVAERVLLGDPFDAATTMGPLNNEATAAKMDEHVADAVRTGSCRPGRGQAGRRVSHRPLLDCHGPGPGPAWRRRGGRGDVRADRPHRRGLFARRRDRFDQRIALRADVSDIHPEPERGAPLRGERAQRHGQHQRDHQSLGESPAVRRRCRNRQRHRAGRWPVPDGDVHGAAHRDLHGVKLPGPGVRFPRATRPGS